MTGAKKRKFLLFQLSFLRNLRSFHFLGVLKIVGKEGFKRITGERVL